MIDQTNIGDRYGSSVTAGKGSTDGVRIRGRWTAECYGADGKLKWADSFHNLVVDAGLNHLLDATLSAGSQITSWYVGLTSSTPSPAAGDTMASHGGWTEVTDYSETVRQPWTDGGVAAKSVTNSASKAAFSINGTVTAGGAFLTSSNVKSGTAGTLYAVGAFTEGNRSLVNGDTLQVTATFTSADDGV